MSAPPGAGSPPDAPEHVHVHVHASGARPRTPADGRFLARFDKAMRLPIILAAVLPLMVSPQPNHPIGVIVGIASWVVFVIDFVVHLRRLDHYLGTGLGKFDLVVVVLTSPWYLLPGVNGGAFIVVLRLARLVRLLIAVRGARRLFARIGRIALVVLFIVVTASAVAFHAEEAVNPEFANYWDSLWWGYVTLTTVGYGDIVPITTPGRWAGVFIMTTGIATLGVLSGSLASFFRLTPDEVRQDDQEAAQAQRDAAYLDTPAADPSNDAPAVALPDAASAADQSQLAALTAQIADLRAEVARLVEHVTSSGPASAGTGTPYRRDHGSGAEEAADHGP
jgi:voltage-gated potassium channel